MPLPATLDPTPTMRPALRRPTERTAVADMVRRYADDIGVDLRPASVTLDSGARVLVDGASTDGTLFVEAHTAPGLRDIDLVLVVQDVFKLALLRGVRPSARTVVLVDDTGIRDAVTARIAGTPAAGLVEIVEVSPRP